MQNVKIPFSYALEHVVVLALKAVPLSLRKMLLMASSEAPLNWYVYYNKYGWLNIYHNDCGNLCVRFSFVEFYSLLRFYFILFFFLTQPILGKLVQRPAKMDKKLVRELKNLADPNMDPYDTVSGKTMCADDFYEGKSNLWIVLNACEPELFSTFSMHRYFI